MTSRGNKTCTHHWDDGTDEVPSSNLILFSFRFSLMPSSQYSDFLLLYSLFSLWWVPSFSSLTREQSISLAASCLLLEKYRRLQMSLFFSTAVINVTRRSNLGKFSFFFFFTLPWERSDRTKCSYHARHMVDHGVHIWCDVFPLKAVNFRKGNKKLNPLLGLLKSKIITV